MSTRQAILYTRVSTVRQATEGESLDAQLAKLRAYAAHEGLEVVAEFSDAGLSGGTMARPGVQAALKLACRTKATVICTTLARWGRSTEEVLASCSALDRAGAGFMALAEGLAVGGGRGNSTSRLALSVLAAVSCWQMEVQQEQTAMTMAHMRRMGRRISRYAPFGWDIDQGQETLIENPAEQAVIATMKELRAAGWSFEAIARDLNERAVPSKLGGRWSGRAVRLVLARLAKLNAA